jgi:hypothetical protein
MKTLAFLFALLPLSAAANPLLEFACAQNANVARVWAEEIRPKYSKAEAAKALLTPLVDADPTDPNVVCTLKGIELVWAEPHKTPDAIAQEFEAWCLVQFGPRQKAE